MEEKISRLSDVADALGLSVSTVSRALSGKGRVGKETTERVKKYIVEHAYQPNMLARGLANGQTYNLCVVLPSDSLTNQIPFFYECLMGICSVAMRENYSTVISTDLIGKTDNLQNALNTNKADGYIVLRATDDDPALPLIMNSGYPLVVTGRLEDININQVDEDNFGITRSFVLDMLKKGSKKPAIILGDMKFNVNRARNEGFNAAIREMGLVGSEVVYQNVCSIDQLPELAAKLEQDGIDTLFCGDDYLCVHILGHLKNTNIKVYALYYSDFLSITNTEAPRFNANALGKRAAELLIEKIRLIGR